MAGGFTSFLTLTVLLLAGVPGFGQIIIPGVGYPGGGYPGRRYPQGGPRGPVSGRQPNNPASMFVGMLRKIGDNNVVIESDDNTIKTISIANSTKYVSASSGSAKLGDFQPGDHVSVSASQDNKSVYHAVKMTMVREGTPEEHSAASLATNDTSRPILSGRSSDGSSASNGGDRPTLRRAASDDTPSGRTTTNNDGGRPTLHRATPSLDDTSSSTSSNSPTNNSDDDHPRLRRAVSSAEDTPKAQIIPGDSSTTASAPTPSSPPK